ncbi:monooxygenase [Streptomyces armeniacus]|uniref:Monooxygenase n=1 Tax=Streptomyces armeniacus TaxID=83291 RepID=A0A345XU16_9ACTN|nr:FAD-dependent monooxygenase [Streptomyces armeniacus]AXK35132.1 monooxygenase [Streptomyces armeniacus]
MRGGSVAVVGGSIAGCATAVAAARGGADRITVFERVGGQLRERGVGLGMHNDRYAELEAAGYVHADTPWTELTRRVWTARDGDVEAGHEIGVQPFPFRGYGWGSLWNDVRGRVPDSVDYRSESTVQALEPDADGVTLVLADGQRERYDVVIGADGYRSVVRDTMFPGLRPEYAGYLGWRGTSPLPLDEDVDRQAEAQTVGFPGGHCMIYPIPDGRGGLRTNWILYTIPPGQQPGASGAASATPPEVTPELLEHLQELVTDHFPPYWAERVLRTPVDETLMQPIYDLQVPQYATGRMLLAGDAATVARPHTGGGAVKALQDALVLERALEKGGTWAEALEAYDEDRTAVGAAMVELGRRLGRAQVDDTPDWGSMKQAEFDAWYQGQHQGSDKSSGFGGHALKRD